MKFYFLIFGLMFLPASWAGSQWKSLQGMNPKESVKLEALLLLARDKGQDHWLERKILEGRSKGRNSDEIYFAVKTRWKNLKFTPPSSPETNIWLYQLETGRVYTKSAKIAQTSDENRIPQRKKYLPKITKSRVEKIVPTEIVEKPTKNLNMNSVKNEASLQSKSKNLPKKSLEEKIEKIQVKTEKKRDKKMDKLQSKIDKMDKKLEKLDRKKNR